MFELLLGQHLPFYINMLLFYYAYCATCPHINYAITDIFEDDKWKLIQYLSIALHLCNTLYCRYTTKTYLHWFCILRYKYYFSICFIFKIILYSSEALFHYEVIITHFIVFFTVWKRSPKHDLNSCERETNSNVRHW